MVPKWRFLVFSLACSMTAACGKKGSPLPPLVHVPAPPPDFTAERRGDDVKLRFTIPSSNTDGTRPANIERIDVYAFTGTFTADNDQVWKYGTRVASVPVKAPKNPALTTEPGEQPEEPDLTDEGLDQGATAELDETLTEEAFKPVVLPSKIRKPADVEPPVLFPEPPREVPWRYFMAVGINTNGRKGPPSKRIIVPLVPSPAPPTDLEITYDETGAVLKWKPSPSWAPIQPKVPDTKPSADSQPLAARFFGMDFATLTYNVYDASPSPARADASAPAAAPPLGTEVKLATTPVGTTDYYDPRIEWGKTRCYVVRAVESITGQALESVAPPPACVTLKDMFPPAAPKDLRLIAAEGVISLIWEPSAEADVAGYIVLRAAPGEMLQPLTPMPITATTYNDKVAAGVRYAYAVQAVDRAGNRSSASNRVEEAAR